MGVFMRREAELWIGEWYRRARRKPLVIRGARQVGKSTLVRQFAARQGLVLCEINLERHLYLDAIFKSLNMGRILSELESLVGRSLSESAVLLFLDEIQATPSALVALRYFYEERPDLPVIGAGSLLEFSLRDHSFSMPVGRIEYLYLGPMNFREFLLALQDTHLLESVQKYRMGVPWPVGAHQKLLHRQREFLLTGGMPEAVLAFKESKSLVTAQMVQESILATFLDDFAKYTRSKGELIRLQHLFRYIPAHVGRKLKYSEVSREEASREIKHALETLSLAKLVTLVMHTVASGVPLDAQENQRIFKSLFLDIGLMNKMCGLDWTAIQSLDDRRLVNEGALAEQFIGQHLLYRDGGHTDPRLHYWIREAKSENAEVDYVISRGDWVVPIEVKAGMSGRLKSLQVFSLLKSSPVCVRFDLNPPSLAEYQHHVQTREGSRTVSYRLLSLPLYMVTELPRLLDDLRR